MYIVYTTKPPGLLPTIATPKILMTFFRTSQNSLKACD